jgi:proline utilization trans-activator
VGKCDDNVWLCRLYVVFALGELYRQGASASKNGCVPGTAYFMKAMDLFEDLYEEPTIEYIETLLAIVSSSLTVKPQDTTLHQKFNQKTH